MYKYLENNKKRLKSYNLIITDDLINYTIMKFPSLTQFLRTLK